MYISEENKKKILEISEKKLTEVISDFSTLYKSGTQFVCECPGCKGERTLNVNPGKNIFKCFRCNEIQGNTPLTYLMKGQGKPFTESLEYLARKFNVILDEPTTTNIGKSKSAGKKTANGNPKKNTFCSRMLAESGLTSKDIQSHVYRSDDRQSIFQSIPFKPGTLDPYGNIIPGDDVIIEYYDLEGFPIRYEQKDSKSKLAGKLKDYFRVRWQYPEEHKNKDGKPFKYKSPPGSQTYIYIPERLRAAYKAKQKIERLFIQEGEKKAEKACKHEIMSVGISGIQNLGTAGRLPEDLIRIIQTCEVKEVCFLLDADWNDLSSSIKVTDQVEKRPRSFFSAVRNYKEYMRTLRNRDLYVEIYFGYIKPNPKKDKGIDDLLSNTLKGKEKELHDDISYLINEKDLSGKYLQLFKITTWQDHKLEEIWSLNSPKKFAEEHINTLKDLPEFRIGKHRWRINEAGELESA